MRFLKIFLLVLLFPMPFSGLKAALPDPFKFSLLDMNDGLAHNQVNCFLKDSKGFVWIGTNGGLSRYDGHQFTNFRHDSKNPASLSENEVQNLYEGPDGYLWVVSYNSLSIYNPRTETFTSGDLTAFMRRYGLQSTSLGSIFKDNKGYFWFLQPGQGLTRYNPKSKKILRLQHEPGRSSGLGSNSISAMSQSKQGDYWVLHQNGLLERLSSQSLQVVERVTDLAELYKGATDNFTLLTDSDNDLWISSGIRSSGVYLYQTFTKKLLNFSKSTPSLRLKSDVVRGVVEASAGSIWIATDHGGVSIVNKQTMQAECLLSNINEKNGLVDNSVNTIYKDSDGILWLGTYKKGFNIYHKDMFRFRHFNNQPAIAGSLPYNDVNRFAEDGQGNLWIGTNGGGLLYFNRTTGQYTRYLSDPNDPNSIGSDVIVSLLIDRHKNLWVGTYTGGLIKFDGKKFTRFNRHTSNLTDDNIWEIFEDSDGVLWVGTMRQGLFRYDGGTGTFRQYSMRDDGTGLQSNYVSALAEDKGKNLWIGGNSGIDVRDKRTGKFTRFRNDPKNIRSLASNSILDIYTDSRQNTWVATPEGLLLYRPADKSFQLFNQESGLPHNIILTILEDDKQNLWVSTLHGLSNVVLQQDGNGTLKASFRNYDESDGLQGRTFNENAAFKTARGEMIFGGPNGFNMFIPDELGKNYSVPKMLFTDFQLFNKSLKVGEERDGRVILGSALSEAPHVTLKHNEDILTIGFAALSFFHPDKNSYKYKLEGFDKDWHETNQGTRQATYTNLDPGEYEFKVLASNNDGIWNKEGISMKITVLAPFWRTTTAYVLYGLLGVVLLYFIREYELRRNRRNFLREQERREVVQMQELNLVKIRFFTNISHEFRTPLALILAPLEKLLKTTADPEQRKQFEMMNRNSRRLLNLVNQLLDFRKLEVEGIQLHLSEGNVIKFVETSVQSFMDLSEKKNIRLSFHSQTDAWYASFDMDKLEKILFNLLSNAFKFTDEDGKIDVTVVVQEDKVTLGGTKVLEIQVQDTGIGIAKEKQGKVFERFFRSDVPTSMVNQGSGIGLAITSEFVKIHGGQISLESEPGSGSCFTVRIPMREMAPGSTEAEPTMAEEEMAVVDMLTGAQTGEEKPAAQRPKSRPVVLLVEDNEDFRFYLKDNLGVHFEMLEAKNGKEGWQKALAHLPDLIVSDLMMPEMDGIALCTKIKQDARTSQIPFVMLTAHKAEELQLKGLGLGANDFISKPFNFEILLSRLQNLIAQRRQLQGVFERKISVETSAVEIQSLDDKLIQRAIQVVEDNLDDPDFSVEAMSRELGMSRVHLYKKMVALTSTSPVEFIRKIRLQRAAQYLEKSQLTVAEVAYKVGFNNRKYFTKYFKEEYHILPSAYAEQHKPVQEVE
ncbi:hybrid sensor histidine kinase/response regulator transcription factor [Pontibacter beigongshangensis]|uniref:hybrid sensor histidine kinase/response regulator transcription factor n=1 Tax=Pontibacter beigongshangensis TaxID=2574733 RepID=UPI001650D121|nr:two-component regulator propeller domain-containing protein [Pontibacter beigongshangensis]